MKTSIDTLCCLCCIFDHSNLLNEWLNYNINVLKADRVFIVDCNIFGNEISKEELNHNLINKITIIPFNLMENKLNICIRQIYDYAFEYIKLLNYDYIAVCNVNEFFYLNNLTYKEFINKELINKNELLAELERYVYDDNDIIYINDLNSNNVTDNYTNKVIIDKSKYIVKIEPWLKFGIYWPDNKIFCEDKLHTRYMNNEKYYTKYYKTQCLEQYIKQYENLNLNNCLQKNIIIDYFQFNIISKDKLNAIFQLCSKYNVTLSYDDIKYILKNQNEFK